tara:strand:+ start:2393 stop:4378 length:1986 start_codon:yes stop_codon:yes gene_type:complete
MKSLTLFLGLLLNSYAFKHNYRINKRFILKSSLQDTPSKVVENLLSTGRQLGDVWSYNDITTNIKNNAVDGVTILTKNNDVQGIIAIDNNHLERVGSTNLHPVVTGASTISNAIIDELIKNHINFDSYQIRNNFFDNFSTPLQIFAIYFLITAFLNAVRLISQNSPGGMGPMQNLFKTPKLIDNDLIDVDFTNVAGCDEAKFELEEIVDFLKDPKKYVDAGAKIPKGILLEGPPGTGKTLLARAVAGEAGVGFISASASEFIEMFVGVGASRVRGLFEQAKKNQPCVIFIDEIDAVGRQRGAGFAGGNDEREQTLNQLLTNMDGFEKDSGIIVLAATNRADILDSALTRPGRFDRKVQVSLPDINGRKAIFDVHFRDKKLASEIDMEELALLTGGFSGADIANLANEAAILSVRYNETEINQKCLTNAYEKITIGLPSAFENREKDILKLVAYHESGHAITVGLFKEFFDVRKVTITSNKGGAGGYTLFTPKEKFNSYPTKKFMLANMIVALGGRAAETVLYSNINSVPINYKNINLFENFDDLDITTGASNDLKQANNIARQYVSLFGLGENIGIYDTTSTNTQSPFLGRDIAMGSSDKLSEYTKSQIDKEIEKLIGFAFQKAIDILNANKNILFDMSEQLLNEKTINSKEFNEYKITYY